MEILALYTSPETLPSALAAGARHLAATLQGFALVYQAVHDSSEPDGWAGFTCAKDAQVAGEELDDFVRQTLASERPLRTDAPEGSPRVWARAAGGVYGFPIRHNGQVRGVALLGCPGPWPRVQNAGIESILRQIALVLDHHAVSGSATPEAEPSDELLRLSEQLLAQDIELIKREERLTLVERLKADLIETMSYELRQPLNSMIERMISVLANEHEALSASGRESLRGVLADGNTLMQMLQNILDLWRLKQNEVTVDVQDVNLAEVLEEAIFNVRDTLQPDVVFEKRIPSALPKIRTDLGKLNQILFHLLDNAAKFTRRGRISLELRLEDGELLCSVTDTGIGIAPDDQEQILDEFYRVDSSPDSRHRGAGLGLTLARGLIEKLGGSLSLQSEIGQGSRFSFSLPVSVVDYARLRLAARGFAACGPSPRAAAELGRRFAPHSRIGSVPPLERAFARRPGARTPSRPAASGEAARSEPKASVVTKPSSLRAPRCAACGPSPRAAAELGRRFVRHPIG